MKVEIPAEKHLTQTSVDDPAPYYYNWALRYPYLKRLKMVLSLLGGRSFTRLLEVGYGSGIFFPELGQRCQRLVGVDLHRNGAAVHKMMELEGIDGLLGTSDVLELWAGKSTPCAFQKFPP